MPPLGAQLLSHDEPKLFRRGDPNSHAPVVPHTRLEQAPALSILMSVEGLSNCFSTLLREDIADHPQQLQFIELDRSVLTMCAPEIGEHLLECQPSILDGMPRHDQPLTASPDEAGLRMVVDPGSLRTTLAVPEPQIEELESFVRCAEHVCGLAPPMRRLELLRQGQKAMSFIQLLKAARVLDAVQDSVRRDPGATLDELIRQGIFRCKPTYRVHVLESRLPPGGAEQFVSDVHAVRARRVARGCAKPLNIHGDADGAEESAAMRDAMEFIVRVQWARELPGRPQMVRAGGMALLRAMARADEGAEDGEVLGPCAYLAPQLPQPWDEHERYLGAAAQSRMLANLVEEDRLMEAARQLALSFPSASPPVGGTAGGCGEDGRGMGSAGYSRRNTTRLYWRARAASSGIGAARSTPRAREEERAAARISQWSQGRHVLDGSGGGAHVPWWPAHFQRACEVATAKLAVQQLEAARAAERCEASVRLAERRAAHARATRRELRRCSVITASTMARAACARVLEPSRVEGALSRAADARDGTTVDFLDEIGMKPSHAGMAEIVALKGQTLPPPSSGGLAIPPPGLGLPRECDNNLIDPREQGRRMAGLEWRTPPAPSASVKSAEAQSHSARKPRSSPRQSSPRANRKRTVSV